MISIPGKIPIIIHPFFWVLILMLGWLNSQSLVGIAVWAIVIFFSVLIHEYGHALTALLFGQKAEIHLVGLGGLTKRNGKEISKWKEFLIVLNGPLAGLCLAFCAYYLLHQMHREQNVLYYALQVAFTVNVFWTIINLLPILPLDGGHLVRIVLQSIFGLRGLKFAMLVSVILAAIVGSYFFFLQQMFMGVLFFMLGFESYRGWEEMKSIAPEDSNENLQELLQRGIAQLKSGFLDEALDTFRSIREKTLKGMLYVSASQYGARVLSEQGNIQKAYDWLSPLKNRLSQEYVHLLQQLAYRLQNWEEAAAIGLQAYQQDPTADTAFLNALCYAIMGKEKPAVGWLHNAIQLGLPNVEEALKKREFDAIRDSESFKRLIS